MPLSVKSGSDERRSRPQNYRKIIKSMFPTGSQANQAATRGIVNLEPFEVSEDRTINKAYFEVGVVSGTCRMAIYKDNGNTPQGGSKVWDSGNVAVIGAGTRATVNYLATPGLYWFAVTFSTNACQYIRQTGAQWTNYSDASFSYASEYYPAGSRSYSKSTVLPDPCPTVTIPTTGIAQMPFFFDVT